MAFLHWTAIEKAVRQHPAHDRLGGLEMDFAAFSGLAIDPSSGRIAVGDRGAGKVHLL